MNNLFLIIIILNCLVSILNWINLKNRDNMIRIYEDIVQELMETIKTYDSNRENLIRECQDILRELRELMETIDKYKSNR